MARTPSALPCSSTTGGGIEPAVAHGVLGFGHRGHGRGEWPAVAEDVAQLDLVRVGGAVTDGGELGLGNQVGAQAVVVADEQVTGAGTGHDGQGHLDGHVVPDPRFGGVHGVGHRLVHGGGARRVGMHLDQRQNVPPADVGQLPDHGAQAAASKADCRTLTRRAAEAGLRRPREAALR
jgi:hypothetical protein